MRGERLHIDRGFIRLYLFSGAWAYVGTAIPALVRGIIWLGILCLLGATLMVVLALHPRTARDLDQARGIVATYAFVAVGFLFMTGLIGWMTGAVRSPLWVVYFASLLVLYGATFVAFLRSVRRTPPTGAGRGPAS